MSNQTLVQEISSVRRGKAKGLTDKECEKAICPEGKKRKRYYDRDGLYLEVDNCGKRWFMKFRRSNGKESRLAIGSYPIVKLKDARDACSDARKDHRKGVDPVEKKKAAEVVAKQGLGNNTFRQAAESWFANKSPQWGSHHQIRERRNLDKDLLPWIGDYQLGVLTASNLLEVLRRVEARTVDVAHRVNSTLNGVLKFAVGEGKIDSNPAAKLKEVLKPKSKKHFGAILDPGKFGHLLLAMDDYKGGAIVKAALLLSPIVFQRPTELRAAKWTEIDFKEKQWTIPAARMKRKKDGKEQGPDHIVPLPTQAINILKDLHCLTGSGVYLFPSERGKHRPLSDAALPAALKSLGYGSGVQTIHGFRASARTMLDEQLNVKWWIIEAQLAHSVRDSNGRSYNRTVHIKQRATMLQKWADYLDKLRAKAHAEINWVQP